MYYLHYLRFTLDERKTLTKISTCKTSHNCSPNQHTLRTTKKQGENPPLKGKQQVIQKRAVCRHTHTIFKYCFPFLPISRIVCTLHTDLFVEVTNVTKGSGIWAHFLSTGCFPTQIQLSRPIQKDDVQIETVCCIFKQIRINWLNINVTGISGTIINMPGTAYVSIFTDNDLTHIAEDHFEIKLIARLLDQMYVVQPPVFPPRYDDALPSAPQFPEHLHSLLTCS